MMAPRMAGFRFCHSPSPLVTLMKSEPKNTPVTPSISNSRVASGEPSVSSPARNSRVPSPSTGRPGMNFSVAGLGVASVWMNMAWPFGLLTRKSKEGLARQLRIVLDHSRAQGPQSQGKSTGQPELNPNRHSHQSRPLRFDWRLPYLQGSVGKGPSPLASIGDDAGACLCGLCGLHAHHLWPPPRPAGAAVAGLSRTVPP